MPCQSPNTQRRVERRMAQSEWGLPPLGNIRPPPASARGITQKSEDSSVPIPPTSRSDREYPTGTPHELKRKNIGQEFPSFLDFAWDRPCIQKFLYRAMLPSIVNHCSVNFPSFRFFTQYLTT